MKKHYLLVFSAWLGVCFLGALFYCFSGFFPDFTNAFFESMSGFTTTGVTVLIDVEALPGWLLLWRSITQWLGGMAFLMIVFLKMKKDALYPFLLYIAFTLIQFLLLAVFGLSWFDAINLSFSSVSTGGFSVRNNSIASYNLPGVEWVCIVFMFIAGINFSLIRWKTVMRSTETRAYAGIIIIAAAVITVALLPHNFPAQSASFGTALRQAFFHVVSLVSTTGFYSADYSLWPFIAQGILFLLLFVGGCSGSASGGVKVIRYVMLSKQAWIEMKRIVYPRGVFTIRLDGNSGNKEAVHEVAAYVFLYFFIVFLTTLLVSSTGADVFTSFKTALICQGNVGPAAGNMVSFANFPAYVKWGLCASMLLGRLGIWAVLILFNRDYWRKQVKQ